MKHLTLIFLFLFCFGMVTAGPISTTVDVAFSHPGDDPTDGTATLIEWKWTADTTLSWDQWSMITDTITPQPFGTADTVAFDIVFPDNGLYWIGKNAYDDAGNQSGPCVHGQVDLPDITGPSCSPGTIIGITRH